MGNEKAMNQLIAHHSIVFEPQKLLVWVSTQPWQLGEYVAYDLNKIFALHGLKQNHEVYDSSLTIPADTFLFTQQFHEFVKYRQMKQMIADGKEVNLDSLVASNPQFYHTYVLAGDYLYKRKEYKKALSYYEIAVKKEVATKPEEKHILDQIKKCLEKSIN